MSRVSTMRRSNRTLGSELVMPENCISLDFDEMEYVDGGVTITWKWWGAYVRLSSYECQRLGDSAGYAADIFGAYSGTLIGISGQVFCSVYSLIISGIDKGAGVRFSFLWTDMNVMSATNILALARIYLTKKVY